MQEPPEERRMSSHTASRPVGRELYTPDQRARRDATRWTLVQGVLAPFQFLVFAVSLVLVLRYMAAGEGYLAATVSVVAKTGILYLIMVTFWEDVVSMIVIALHTLYLVALIGGWMSPQALMITALAAYVTYVANASQFILKLRAARLQSTPTGALA
jgi:3-vinyl bacteriochlorophyllide hydratase